MLGREVYMPADLTTAGSALIQEGCEPQTYVEKLQEQLQITHTLAREHLKQAQARQKHDHDLHACTEQYEAGDLVYVKDTSRKKGRSPKLQPLWTGPAVVIQPLGTVLYKIREQKKTRILHYERLKPCHSTNIPLWISRLRTTDVATATAVEGQAPPRTFPTRAIP